ncbi:MAG: AAA family ATPase, partial [Thermoflexales bacterium]|nr:AAA family ATPase [Thermoflexales bacterium]
APAPAAATPPSSLMYEPPAPRSIEDTGLNMSFLTDLALKIMYYEGNLTGMNIADRMKLPFSGVVDQVLEWLKREQLAEVRGSGGFGEQAYQYTISTKGREKAHEALERSQYGGPAPVTLNHYVTAMTKQALKSFAVTQRSMRQALSHMVLSERTFGQIGPAVNSGKSIFLYGPPGDGKTTIAEAVGRMILGNDILIPYAIEVDGAIIKVYDASNHQRVAETQTTNLKNRDPRWVKVHRPVIITGGELTLETLDLVWDEVHKYYEAPFQMKANSGMFLIDDFGRQQVRPRDLLNRWIVPLEKRVDYLTLHTGRKIEIPFDVLIVFSTNLAPRDLVDEAFLRRIRHKIEIGDPTFEEFREIFKRVANAKKMQFDERALAYLLQEYYVKARRRLRAVHPRDLIEQMVDIGKYMDVPMVMTKELIDRACDAYFVEL